MEAIQTLSALALIVSAVVVCVVVQPFVEFALEAIAAILERLWRHE